VIFRLNSPQRHRGRRGCTEISIKKIKRNTIEPQQLVVFTVIGADYDECDLERCSTFSEKVLCRLRDVDAVIAWRVVMAWTLVILTRPARWQIAMTRSTDAIRVAENRE